MEDKKLLKKARTIINNLKNDSNRQQTVEKTKKIEIFKGLPATKTYSFSW